MSNSSATFQRYHLVRHRPNASAAVTSLDPKQIHFLVGYFYPLLPDPGAFLERILSPTKMTRALFSLYLEIGVPRMYSGILTVAEIRKGYEMKRGNCVGSRHYYYYYSIWMSLVTGLFFPVLLLNQR